MSALSRFLHLPSVGVPRDVGCRARESCTRLTQFSSVQFPVSPASRGSSNLIFTPRFSCSFSWSYFIVTLLQRRRRCLSERKGNQKATLRSSTLATHKASPRIRGKTRYKPCTMLPQSARGSNARDMDQLREPNCKSN